MFLGGGLIPKYSKKLPYSFGWSLTFSGVNFPRKRLVDCGWLLDGVLRLSILVYSLALLRLRPAPLEPLLEAVCQEARGESHQILVKGGWFNHQVDRDFLQIANDPKVYNPTCLSPN